MDSNSDPPTGDDDKPWEWSTETVVRYLREHPETSQDFSRPNGPTERFFENEIDGRTALGTHFDSAVLLQMGITSVPQRVRIMQVLEHLRENVSKRGYYERARQVANEIISTVSRKPVQVGEETASPPLSPIILSAANITDVVTYFDLQSIRNKSNAQATTTAGNQDEYGDATPPHSISSDPLQPQQITHLASTHLEQEEEIVPSNVSESVELDEEQNEPDQMEGVIDNLPHSSEAKLEREDVVNRKRREGEMQVVLANKRQKRVMPKGRRYLRSKPLKAFDLLHGIQSADDELTEFTLPHFAKNNGTSQYVNNMIKRLFLSKRHSRDHEYDDFHGRAVIRNEEMMKYDVAICPIPPRLLEKHVSRRIIILTDKENKPAKSHEYYREHLNDFPTLRTHVRSDFSVSEQFGENGFNGYVVKKDCLRFLNPKDNSDRYNLDPKPGQSDEEEYWKGLEERWLGDLSIMPPLRDENPSDDEYEALLSEEEKAKDGKKNKKPSETEVGKALSEDEVQKIIYESIDWLVEQWQARKASREAKAYRIWISAHKQKNRKFCIKKLDVLYEESIEQLSNAGMQIFESTHTSVKQLHTFARSALEVVVQNREEFKWELDVLRGPKPTKPEPKPRKTREVVDKDADEIQGINGNNEVIESDEDMDDTDAEDISDDEGMNDFVVGDNVYDEDHDKINNEIGVADISSDSDDEETDEGEVEKPKKGSLKGKKRGALAPDSDEEMVDAVVAEDPIASPAIKSETIEEPLFVNSDTLHSSDIIDLTQGTPDPETPKKRKSKRMLPHSWGKSFSNTQDTPITIDSDGEADSSEPNGKADTERGETNTSTPSRNFAIFDNPSSPRNGFMDDDEDGELQRALEESFVDGRKHAINMALIELTDSELEAVQIIAKIRPKDLIFNFQIFCRDKALPGLDDKHLVGYRKLVYVFARWCKPIDKNVSEPSKNDINDNDKVKKFFEDLCDCFGVEINDPVEKETSVVPALSQPTSSAASFIRRNKRREVQEDQDAKRRRAEKEKEQANRQRRAKERAKKMGVASFDSADGTFLINPGHLAKHEDIFLSEGLGKYAKPHQLNGIRFMWDEVVGSKQRGGALLAHTMGLGKTFQVVALLYTIAKSSANENPKIRDQIPKELHTIQAIIIAPPALLKNWQDEFKKWVPDFNCVRAIDSGMSESLRFENIKKWANHGGVLLIGYHIYMQLVEKFILKAEPPQPDRSYTTKKYFVQCILDKTNIVVADEAHLFKNHTRKLAKCMKMFQTPCRIGMTGSPLANNLLEYFSLIDWLDEGYLGPLREFRSRFVNAIENGLYSDSAPEEKRHSTVRLRALRKMLDTKMHRCGIDAIKADMPQKTEFCLTIPMTKLQKRMYDAYIKVIHDNASNIESLGKGFLGFITSLNFLLSHPKLLLDSLENRDFAKIAEVDDDSEDSSEPPTTVPVPDATDETVVENTNREILKLCRSIIEDTPNKNSIVEHSFRIKALMKILEMCQLHKEKVLVFSHSVATLDLIELALGSAKMKFCRLDGKTKVSDRQGLTLNFNAKENQTLVFLISTKAGGLGLNLPGANRVVIYDYGMSPQWEEQAVGRAYRLGQKKQVFVYRFTVGGTYQEKVREKSIHKMQLALRVVDKKNPTRHAKRGTVRDWFKESWEVELKKLDEFVGKDPKVLDEVMKEGYVREIVLQETFEAHHEEVFSAEDEAEIQAILNQEQLRRHGLTLPSTQGPPGIPPTPQAFNGPSLSQPVSSNPFLNLTVLQQQQQQQLLLQSRTAGILQGAAGLPNMFSTQQQPRQINPQLTGLAAPLQYPLATGSHAHPHTHPAPPAA